MVKLRILVNSSASLIRNIRLEMLPDIPENVPIYVNPQAARAAELAKRIEQARLDNLRCVDQVRLFIANRGKGIATLVCFTVGSVGSYGVCVWKALGEGEKFPQAFFVGAQIFYTQKLPVLRGVALVTMTVSIEKLVHGATVTAESGQEGEVVVFAYVPAVCTIAFVSLVRRSSETPNQPLRSAGCAGLQEENIEFYKDIFPQRFYEFS